MRNAFTRYLARKLVPTMMGFDPLVQFLHEVDAIAALHLALLRDVPGTFNVVGEGVLPLSTVIKLAGRIALPIPHPLAETHQRRSAGSRSSSRRRRRSSSTCASSAWPTGSSRGESSASRPAYTSREALLDFVSAQRLRDVKLLTESTA